MNKTLIYLFSLFFISCNHNLKKTEELQNEIIRLETKINKQNVNIDSILNIQKNLALELKDCIENTISEEELEATFNIYSNEQSLIEYLFYKIKKTRGHNNPGGHTLLECLTRLYPILIGNTIYWSQTKKGIDFHAHKIIRKFNRSPEYLYTFFDNNKNFIYSLLKNNKTFLKNSGLKLFIKSLIISYEDVISKRDKFKTLHNIAEKYRSAEDEQEEHLIFANTLPSENFKIVFDKENLDIENQIIFHDYNRCVFYIYSFWSRRVNENNDETVYNILKNIDSAIY